MHAPPQEIKIGDLVRYMPLEIHDSRFMYEGERAKETLGIVLEVYHPLSTNEALKVKMINGDIRVSPSEDWVLVADKA